MKQIGRSYLKLFASIECGDLAISNLVRQSGPDAVIDKILSGELDAIKTLEKKREKLNEFDFEAIAGEIANSNSIFIYPGHELWPSRLQDLKNPPLGLVIKGQIDLLENYLDSISIVGTRNPTSYGLRIAGDFAAAIADQNWAVVSGGALGIDSAAHYGALAAEGVTIAILGGGVNQPYPLANEKLFNEILAKGVLISEVLPNVHPVPHRFLIRNRIIAALSKGTLVVEAAYRSGSLRTAREAAELFRPVMAIPGPINIPSFEGCHRLITDRCAELVSNVSDIMAMVNVIC